MADMGGDRFHRSRRGQRGGSSYRRLFNNTSSPLSRIEAEIFRSREAPPSYNAAMGITDPYEEAHSVFLDQIRYMLSLSRRGSSSAAASAPTTSSGSGGGTSAISSSLSSLTRTSSNRRRDRRHSEGSRSRRNGSRSSRSQWSAPPIPSRPLVPPTWPQTAAANSIVIPNATSPMGSHPGRETQVQQVPVRGGSSREGLGLSPGQFMLPLTTTSLTSANGRVRRGRFDTSSPFPRQGNFPAHFPSPTLRPQSSPLVTGARNPAYLESVEGTPLGPLGSLPFPVEGTPLSTLGSLPYPGPAFSNLVVTSSSLSPGVGSGTSNPAASQVSTNGVFDPNSATVDHSQDYYELQQCTSGLVQLQQQQSPIPSYPPLSNVESTVLVPVPLSMPEFPVTLDPTGNRRDESGDVEIIQVEARGDEDDVPLIQDVQVGDEHDDHLSNGASIPDFTNTASPAPPTLPFPPTLPPRPALPPRPPHTPINTVSEEVTTGDIESFADSMDAAADAASLSTADSNSVDSSEGGNGALLLPSRVPRRTDSSSSSDSMESFEETD